MDSQVDIRFGARARCFRGANGGAGVLARYSFALDPDGTVRVWDEIAGHYTLHHGMTSREEARVRTLAQRSLAPTRG